MFDIMSDVWRKDVRRYVQNVGQKLDFLETRASSIGGAHYIRHNTEVCT